MTPLPDSLNKKDLPEEMVSNINSDIKSLNSFQGSERELKRVTSKMHAHRRAMRKMIKVFLLDLYLEWREIEGLEVSLTYAEEEIHGKIE